MPGFIKENIIVNHNVLIPRPETEELVSWIIDDLKASNKNTTSASYEILDIGTGSGCIAISLKKELPHSDVNRQSILSEEALAIGAKRNAEWIELGAEVKFYRN